MEAQRVERARGKAAKRPLRARPSPYARPQSDIERQPRGQQDGWFSKFLVRPASRILPSLFAPATINQEDPRPSESVPENEQDDFISSTENELEDVDGDTTLNPENLFPESKALGPETGQPKVEFKGSGLVADKQGDAHASIGLNEIEQRLKHKMFTRDESDRLIELLRSRTADLSDDNGHAAGSTVQAAEVALGQKDSKALLQEDAVDRRITLRTSEPFTLGQKNSRTLIKEDDVDHRITLKTYEPFQLTAHDASSSPIDIAKAYMEAQKSASGYDCQSGILKNEKMPVDDAGSALSLSSAMRSPVCWPGAVVHGDHGYLTPQIQRGRSGLRNIPRTPYSGALFSRSTSKFQGVGERSNRPSAGWKQPYTPVFGGNMRSKRSYGLDDGLAQANLIRHARQKNMSATASEGAGPSNPTTDWNGISSPATDWKGISTPYQNLERGSSKGSYGNFRSIHEDGDSSRSTVGLTVHPQSSKMAQRILEHLDRPVFPKEKSLELELAFARTKSPPKSAAVLMDGQDKRFDVRISDDPRTGREMGSQESELPQKVFPWPSTSKSQDKGQPSSLPPQTAGLAVGSAPSELFQMPKSQAPLFSGIKPSGKIKASDNGFGFTFPVSPASNVFSEPPPTPTMSSSLAASRALPTSDETIPTFNFGSSKANDRLVFSFGSIAGSAITDAATPTFKFGSDEKHYMSFKSVANDAICY